MEAAPENTSLLLVLCHWPAADDPARTARRLVESGLVACVNLLPPVQSVYRWQGTVETATEVPLWMKTTPAHFARLQAQLCAWHPYSVPEIIALPVCAALPAYAAWVQASLIA